MTSAVDGLKQRFMDMSQPDVDGVYRNGAAKRKARTDLAMDCLTKLWQEACRRFLLTFRKLVLVLARWVRWPAAKWDEFRS